MEEALEFVASYGQGRYRVARFGSILHYSGRQGIGELLRKVWQALVLRGEIRERSVMHAETAFEPLSFFDEVVAVLPEPPPDGRLIGESFECLE